MKGNASPTARDELQDALGRYVTDTFAYADTARGFCEKISKWTLRRETELQMMMDIKERADGIDLNISHLTKSGGKAEALWCYLKSKVTAGSRQAELQKELAAVLKDTLGGLETLDRFLDAAEKLAVTSLPVLAGDGRAFQLPAGISLGPVGEVVVATRLICPRLLEFKRDANVFFLPRLKNIEVLAYQLDKYIQTTQEICYTLEKRSFSYAWPKMRENTAVDLDGDFSEDDVQRMLRHINRLEDIRMNPSFRLVYLFREMSCSHFIDEFSRRQHRMLQCLRDLEDTAVQLDRMNKGAKISSVAGSSVGAVGGVLSIVGLSLIPLTAGLSLALTAAGIGLGVTSGVNSLVTVATEIGVNRTQQKKANDVMKSLMEDVAILQDCLEEVVERGMNGIDVALGVGRAVLAAGGALKGIDGLIDAASAIKMTRYEELIRSVGRAAAQEGKALRNVPRVASDLPDIGQAAAKGTLALSKSARAGLIAVNSLFLGLDVFLICKDSVSLHEGSETEFSRFVRARATLWGSEMDSWQRIHDSLREGLPTQGGNQALLETPFYPEMEVDKKRETRTESDEVDGNLKETKRCVLQ